MLSFPTKAFLPIFWISLTGSQPIFLCTWHSLCICLFFWLLCFRLSVILSRQTFFRKLLFLPVQSISLKILSCSLLSVNKLFVTHSYRITFSLLKRFASIILHWTRFITTSVSSFSNDSITLSFQTFVKFLNFFARLLCSCFINFT